MKLSRSVPLLAFLLAFAHLAVAQPGGKIISRIKREPVVSSNVASIGYSRSLHALEIEFTRGVTYRYLDVPRSVYLELMEAGSKGHFIALHIRGQYRYVYVRTRKSGASVDQLTAAHTGQ